ncbi:acetyl-CoA carboxylase biotin carboxyl carrier protein subunit [Nocardia nova]|uniref:Biotin carboxyl carrier protein of acetyl-CoA carboxylase n=1 Tax=Nocardia nova TaxID=37330 RepID=A0A2S6AKE5_9NOCA|nr:biotin/lipoyl-containing protein [Nocardia nova]PPJ24911.1 acetyl-CoA carboxylase biotin carboxyl carrier protein subunit [Nocardia nova]PPJ35673.1 acetyl-CoA carboxylase biotin carboxyl carrier protein subunit [Nocardia nova]
MTTMDENVTPARELDAAQHDYLQVLDAIQSGALRLLAGFPAQPSGLRIQVGAVTVEAQWPQGPAEAVVGAGAAPAPATDSASEVTVADPVIRAPSVGVFYRSPQPGAEPFVAVGDRVSPGRQVGIVEAMKLMIPVTAEAGGVVTAILKQDGESVQFDEPLFSYSPE